MKPQFPQPRTTIFRENHLTADKHRSPSTRKQKFSKENAPPSDPNSLLSPSVAGKNSPAPGKLKSHLPPRPPSSNPLKRKLNMDTLSDNGVTASTDSGVKVVVRMRPLNKDEEEGDMLVEKIAGDSVSILGQTFTFDSVADVNSSQLDIFQLVGAPLVENCLAGFNSSVFAYGQTGSGKTYTIWGPTNALLEENISDDQQGLTPRVFQRLFSRINEEQNKHADKDVRYQCRCSFLEIYNEQITDLLDPNQKNLQIREDVKTGVYVENLTEECVTTMKEVTQVLTKGLSNRRIGATSINVESSRSHSVFTCIVESRYKSVQDGLSCLKTSRINLVDLAGSERQKLTGAAGERLKEAGNINRSLSQLGNLINILAEVSQTGKQRHIPYRDSKLTFLLQESLGGNSKLAMVCAVSPAQSCKNETLSTLRFAQRAKAIKNKAVVNEQMQNDVNVLREVIKQLKDELLLMKTNGNPTVTTWNARRSMNLLKFSLNRPMILPSVDEDGDEEMEIIDETDSSQNKLETSQVSISKESPKGVENCEIVPSKKDSCGTLTDDDSKSPVFSSPTPSVSPEVNTSSRKSLRTSSMLTASQKDVRDNTTLDCLSSANPSKSIATSKNSFLRTEVLAASLHRGLEIMDNHRQSSILRRSSFRLSPLSSRIRKVDVGIQTLMQDDEKVGYLCNKCKNRNSEELKDDNETSNLQLVPVDGPPSTEKPKNQLPKAVEKVLAGAIRREMAIEEFCDKQNSEIMHLNRLIQQYRHERECNAMIAQTREDKIFRLETLMDGVLSTENYLEDELGSLKIEHELLNDKYENHPEVSSMKIELKRAQDELERYQNFFNMGERDVLLEEIQDLRSQLQYYVESTSQNSEQKQNPPLLLTYPCEPEQTESKWISLVEELKAEVEASRSLAEKQKQELDMEKKCSEEVKEAMQIAIEGHARLLEQYADLEEKHMELLVRHRNVMDGIDDIKKAAARAGVRGNESKLINALTSEISALKNEREKERRYFRDENNGLRAQLRYTAEAVQAAGELLVRLKEADETIGAAQKRAAEAEAETAKMYKEVDKLKRKHEKKIKDLVSPPPSYEEDDCMSELQNLPEPCSWFSGYDRCNI